MAWAFFGLVHSARRVAIFVVVSGMLGSTVLASLGQLSNLGLAS